VTCSHNVKCNKQSVKKNKDRENQWALWREIQMQEFSNQDLNKLKKLKNILKLLMLEWNIQNNRPILSKKIFSGLISLLIWHQAIAPNNSYLKHSYILPNQLNSLLLVVSYQASQTQIMSWTIKAIISSLKQITPSCYLLRKSNNLIMLISLVSWSIKDSSIHKKDTRMKMMELKSRN